MTRIEFYFNVADKHEVVANLVQLALPKRRQVTIFTADDNIAASVSDYLWQNKPTDFLPNIQARHAHKIHAAVTPVVIGSQANQLMHDDMLINLTTNEPIFFSRFTQLVELVGLDEEDKIAGRQRYKFYRDRGYEIKNIDHAKIKFGQ